MSFSVWTSCVHKDTRAIVSTKHNLEVNIQRDEHKFLCSVTCEGAWWEVKPDCKVAENLRTEVSTMLEGLVGREAEVVRKGLLAVLEKIKRLL